MAIKNNAIANTGSELFICPGSQTDQQEHAVTCIIFCNVSTTDVLLSLYMVPNESTIGDTSKVINELTIPATETFSFDTEKMVLGTGDRVYAIASGNDQLVSTISTMRVS